MKKHSASRARTHRLVFNIGSATIRVALVAYAAKNAPTVIYSAVTDIPFQRTLQYARYERAMLTALLELTMKVAPEVAASLQVAHAGKEVEVVCVLSSPWFLQGVRSVTVKKEKPFTITNGIIERLRTEERGHFLETLSQGQASTTLNTSVSMEAELLRVTANGYTTLRPIGKSCRECTMVFYFSELSAVLREKLNESLAACAERYPMRYASSAFVMYRGVLALYEDSRNCLIIDVTGEITEVSLVQDGLFVASSSFPIGARSLVRAVQKNDTVSYEEALSRITLHAGGKIDLEKEDEFFAEMKLVLEQWSAACVAACHDLFQGTPLPTTTYVLAETLWHAWLTSTLEKIDVASLTFSSPTVQPVVVRQDFIDSHIRVQNMQHSDIRMGINILGI